MELTVDQALQQGVAAHKEGKLEDAERLYRAILQSQPLHPDANHNLGALAVSVNKADAALPLFKIALEANPKIEQFWLSYIDALIKEKQIDNAKAVLEQAKNQGVAEEKLNVLETHLTPTAQVKEPKLAVQKKSLSLSEKRKKSAEQKKQKKAKKQNLKAISPPEAEINNLLYQFQNGLYGDAEKLALSITERFPEHEFGWKALGAILSQTGRFSESLAPNQKSVQLAPRDAEAHYNLGETLKKLGKLDEAQESCKQAITLKSDFAEAHNNLGVMQQELGRLDEAEASYTQAITLKPDFAAAYFKLGQILYANGDIDRAIEIHQKAYEIDSSMRENELLLNVLRSKITRGKTAQNINTINKRHTELGLNSNIIIQDRVVEAELISHLYEINSSSLDEAPGPRYGNGRCSPDYSLFDNDQFIIKTVKDDLTMIMKLAVKSEIYVFDSFFNIYGAGAGITPHQHFNKLDKDKYHNLERQKYSLVYYLSVGDQDCSEPGILKLYGPEQDILPCEGMIIIFPASRMHSAVYGGQTDRVMIGVNFYSL